MSTGQIFFDSPLSEKPSTIIEALESLGDATLGEVPSPAVGQTYDVGNG